VCGKESVRSKLCINEVLEQANSFNNHSVRVRNNHEFKYKQPHKNTAYHKPHLQDLTRIHIYKALPSMLSYGLT